MRKNVKDQCQAVIEIITGGCIWYERGKKLCASCVKENLTVLNIFHFKLLYNVQKLYK